MKNKTQISYQMKHIATLYPPIYHSNFPQVNAIQRPSNSSRRLSTGTNTNSPEKKKRRKRNEREGGSERKRKRKEEKDTENFSRRRQACFAACHRAFYPSTIGVCLFCVGIAPPMHSFLRPEVERKPST